MLKHIGLLSLVTVGMVLLLNYPRDKDQAAASLSPKTEATEVLEVDLGPEYDTANENESLTDEQTHTLLSNPFLSEPKFDFLDEGEIYNHYLSDDGRERRFIGETTLKSGQNFFSVLRSLGIEAPTILSMAAVCRDTYNIDRLPAGILVRVFKEKDPEIGNEAWLIKIELSQLETLQIRQDQGGFGVELVEAERTIAHKVFTGKVEETLWVSVRNSGLPGNIAADLNQILGGYLGQGRAQKNDEWQVVVEEFLVHGNFASYGAIIAAAYKSVSATKPVTLYRFEHEDVAPGFYHGDGSSLDMIFSQTPVPGARITSGFSNRFHPVLKIMRPHLGVDYAAPMGTAVKTVGHGRVVEMNVHPSLGKMLKIRHVSGFETMYGHLSGFARNIKVGAQVEKGAVIGYVGMTGRTTGPHLHFAMLQNKKFVNPRKITFPKKETLNGPALAIFQDHVGQLKKQLPEFELL